MGILRETLNVHVPWSEPYAQIVGMTYPGPVLPAQTLCPFCHKNRLSIYTDVSAKGYWHYCHDCFHSGDLIELAAGVWGMEPATALIRLHKCGLPMPAAILEPAQLESYLAYHVQYRSRMRQLWETARHYLANFQSDTIARLRQRFRLLTSISVERWVKESGQLIGFLPTMMVENCFCPEPSGTGGQNPQRRYHCNPSAQRVFQGRGWDDVLMVPYYDLPERFSGFFFVGRDGEQSRGDFVFRPLRHGFVHDALREAGIAWLPTILRQANGQNFVAVADPFLALRLQIRNSQISMRLLPLLAWYDGPEARTTAAAWHILEGRKVVFWGWRLDHKLLHQAIQAEGWIALIGPAEVTPKTIDHYLRDQAPFHLIRKVLKHGKPLRQAVREWINDNPDGVVEDLFLRLVPYGHRIDSLAAELGRPERLIQLFDRPGLQREARVGKVSIIEQAGCWYCGPSRRRRELVLISDVILRLDSACVKNGQRVYSGRILYHGEETAFADAPATTMETKKVISWLRQVLLANGKGVPRYDGHHFGITLFEVALCFQQPQPRPSADDSGV
jgi:hypothetical protein